MSNKGMKKQVKKEDRRDRISAILMLSPVVFLLLICSIYPFLWMFRYVCYDYNGFSATFTGARNFTRMISDTTFWSSVGHTFEYAFYKLVFIIPLALICAVLLNQKIISGMIFTFIFATQNGILNGILMALGMGAPVQWLTSPDHVMTAVTVLAVWGGFGNYMLYFITGMNVISEDVYEAAKIDGANGVQTFFKITLPMLSPILKVVLMLAITGAFKDYEAIMVLTQGGPGNRSMVMFLYIYNMIFGSGLTNMTQPQIGYGALLSVVAAVIVGLVTIAYQRIARRLDDVM